MEKMYNKFFLAFNDIAMNHCLIIDSFLLTVLKRVLILRCEKKRFVSSANIGSNSFDKFGHSFT